MNSALVSSVRVVRGRIVGRYFSLLWHPSRVHACFVLIILEAAELSSITYIFSVHFLHSKLFSF